MEIFISELKRARDAAGLTQEELAKQVNYSDSFVAMVETNRRMPSRDFAARCDATLHTDGFLSRLLDHELRRAATPKWFRPWLEVERHVSSLRTYQPVVVPGLLQTAEYARALLRDETLVTARMERQTVLSDLSSFIVVLDEAVLTRSIGEPATMVEQLGRLIGEPKVALHIVPAGVGAYVGLNGPLTLAMIDGTELAMTESQLRGSVYELPEDVSAMRDIWETVRSEAVNRDQSTKIIKEAIDQWKNLTSASPADPAPRAETA